jgi:hypothetical protein
MVSRREVSFLLALAASSCRATPRVAPAPIDAGPLPQTVDATIDVAITDAAADAAEPPIDRLGYRVVQDHAETPTSWERSTFGTRSKHVWRIRGKAPRRGSSDTYYRYDITLECYASTTGAAQRERGCRTKPPGLMPEDDKAFPLRRCVTQDVNVWVLSTDVAVFETDGELDRLATEFRQAPPFGGTCR